MSGIARCYDNATGGKLLCDTEEREAIPAANGAVPMAYVKTVIFRYVVIYYNRQLIYTANPTDGHPRYTESNENVA